MHIADRVLFRDGLILVLDKPAGWSCTPSGPGQHLTAHLKELTFGKTTLPQVAHRLDRDTSGCLVLGRHAAALRKLGQLFAENKVVKTYWARVQGLWPEQLTLLEAPVQGQSAETHVRLLEHDRLNNFSFIELRPVTGRTHQLRIHCQQQGHPIVGDPRYGDGRGDTMYLHARSIELPLYKRAPVRVEAPLPESWV